MTTMPEPANGKDPSTLGADLAETIKAGGGKPNKTVSAAIAKLKKGETPSNSALVALRDFVNEVAAEARASEKPEQVTAASRLSTLNRAVRRMERATRK
jgi:hypothetical protein